jgi:hypothetical protein
MKYRKQAEVFGRHRKKLWYGTGKTLVKTHENGFKYA